MHPVEKLEYANAKTQRVWGPRRPKQNYEIVCKMFFYIVFSLEFYYYQLPHSEQMEEETPSGCLVIRTEPRVVYKKESNWGLHSPTKSILIVVIRSKLTDTYTHTHIQNCDKYYMHAHREPRTVSHSLSLLESKTLSEYIIVASFVFSR